jgi:hypothetical protein
MIHRHLTHSRHTLAALDNLLENGTLADWRPVLARVRREPDGEVARCILALLRRRDYQETGELWCVHREGASGASNRASLTAVKPVCLPRGGGLPNKVGPRISLKVVGSRWVPSPSRAWKPAIGAWRQAAEPGRTLSFQAVRQIDSDELLNLVKLRLDRCGHSPSHRSARECHVSDEDAEVRPLTATSRRPAPGFAEARPVIALPT